MAVRALLGASVAAAVAIPAWWSHWIDSPLTGLVNLLVAGSFAATAAVLHADPGQRSTARDIGLSAVFYLASWGWTWPPLWQASPLPLLSFVGGYLWFVCLGTALVRYPHARLEHRYQRRFLLAFARGVCCVKAVLSALSEPGWAGFDNAAWWPRLAPDRGLFDTLTMIFNGGLVVLVIGLLAMLLLKIRRGQGLERVDTVPAVMAAAAIAVFGVIYLGTRILGLPDDLQDAFRIATSVAALATPVSFLAVVVRRQVLRSAAADFLPRIYYASSLVDARAELRRALRDPDLQLWLRRPGEDAHIAVDGNGTCPTEDFQRCLVEVRSSDDQPLAVIGLRRSLLRHHRLVESAADAIGMVLERRATHEEAQAWAGRLHEAEHAARRTIARDLHDGVQQVLLTARLRLATATRAAGPSTMQAIDRARADVDAALEVIRDVAAGEHSPLAGRQLADALADLTCGAGLPVALRVSAGQLPDVLERTVWYLVSEGLPTVSRECVIPCCFVRSCTSDAAGVSRSRTP